MELQICLEFAAPNNCDQHGSAEICRDLVEFMARRNLETMRRAMIPPLYKSGIRYTTENGLESIKDCILCLEVGETDCASLTAYRLAELWLKEDRRARCCIEYVLVNGVYSMHALVRRGNKKKECPSTILGM